MPLLLTLLLGFALSAKASPPPTVFIHGIKGGKLVDKTESLQWLNAWEALGLSSPSLKLALSWPGGRQPEDDLIAHGILDFVPIIPFLYEPAVYGPWLKAAAKFPGGFYPFAYDWRRENAETAAKFEQFLDALKSQAPNGFRVVAHSMGGLVTLNLLHRRPELFHSVVFAGVPFAGGIGFLPDLHQGTSAGLNSRILSPEVLATFPSVYTLFPETSTSLASADGSVTPMNFFSAAAWKERRLGYFAERRTVPAGFEPFLAGALTRAKTFRQGLAPRAVKYPPILVVNGKSFPTLSRAVQKPDGDWDFEIGKKDPGDGRVLETHSTPPVGIPFEVFSSDKDHAELLNDPKVIRRLELP